MQAIPQKISKSVEAKVEETTKEIEAIPKKVSTAAEAKLKETVEVRQQVIKMLLSIHLF